MVALSRRLGVIQKSSGAHEDAAAAPLFLESSKRTRESTRCLFDSRPSLVQGSSRRRSLGGGGDARQEGRWASWSSSPDVNSSDGRRGANTLTELASGSSFFSLTHAHTGGADCTTIANSSGGNNGGMDERTCSSLAERGRLRQLQWVRAQGCPWDESTCYAAAKGGHLSVLEWARSQDCPWDEEVCAEAAAGGHLELLQWARGNGCPWDSFTTLNALEHGHEHVLAWARANGCPCDEANAKQHEQQQQQLQETASATVLRAHPSGAVGVDGVGATAGGA